MAKTANQNFQSLLKLLRSNFSTFLLGLTVLLIIVLVVSLFVKKNPQTIKSGKSWTAGLAEMFTGKREPTPKPKQSLNNYQVKEGDSLWMIAEATYGSGYNSVDIAKANNLPNPDLIEPGQNLVLPKVTSKEPTTGQTVGAMTSQAVQRPREYTVQQGDFLWQIAQRFYGDGYSWVKIAHANNLQNPNLIYAGTKLLLP